MLETRNSVQYTRQVIAEKTAVKDWWKDLYPDHRYAAKMRERGLAGTLKDENVNKMMKHFKKKCVQLRQDALWDDEIELDFHVFSTKEDFGIIKAFTEEEAKEKAAKLKWNDDSFFIDADGDKVYNWENLKCKLKAEEVK